MAFFLALVVKGVVCRCLVWYGVSGGGGGSGFRVLGFRTATVWELAEGRAPRFLLRSLQSLYNGFYRFVVVVSARFIWLAFPSILAFCRKSKPSAVPSTPNPDVLMP